jgi:hypothetical protein
MRVSSVMLPASSCGTFRSARMKTRLPLAEPVAQRSEKRMKDKGVFMNENACAGKNVRTCTTDKSSRF